MGMMKIKSDEDRMLWGKSATNQSESNPECEAWGHFVPENVFICKTACDRAGELGFFQQKELPFPGRLVRRQCSSSPEGNTMGSPDGSCCPAALIHLPENATIP